MINPWFKFYGSEYLSDPKIGSLSPQERSCWITLLCMAGTSSVPGLIEYLTVEVLLQKSGIIFDPYHPEEWDKCLSILKRLEKLRMVSLSENGSIEVVNWDKRQETNLSDAERAKSYRDRKKIVTKSSHDDVTIVTLEENRKEENREEESIESSLTLSKKEKDAQKIREAAFDSFWEAYPRKTDKIVSKRRFLKISPKLYSKIMEALEIQKKTKQWQDKDFIPQASSWLNRERYEDVVTASTIDPIEAEARALIKQFPPDNDTTAQFRFSRKYGNENLLRFKHLFNL